MSPPPQSFSHYPSWPPPVQVELPLWPSQPCPYLPDRDATYRGGLASPIPVDLLGGLLDSGFRRNGKVLYQPACAGCRNCVPLRVVVRDFRPTRSQRRCAARNADLRVDIDTPRLETSKMELFNRYNLARHDTEPVSQEELLASLYADVTDSIEFTYRDASGNLLAVGLCDVTETIISSVYFFYEPDGQRRGLGTFGVLREIEIARELGRPFYHLGYWVIGSPKMAYKRAFGPHQLLGTDGVWRDAATASEQ